MGEFASITSKDRKEMLEKNRLDILAYQYPPTIDSSITGIQKGQNILVIFNYGNIEISRHVNETHTPAEILGYCNKRRKKYFSFFTLQDF